MRAERVVITVLMTALGLTSCSRDCLNTREVRDHLNRELKVGDPRARVDEVLKSASIDFSYDKFQHRYQSYIKNAQCSQWRAISIYVTFDKSDRMSKVEVFDSYTYP